MRKAIIALVLITVIGGAWLINGKDAEGVKAAPTEGITQEAPSSLPDHGVYSTTILRELAQATLLAREWQADAYLVANSLELVNGFALDKMTYNYYVFKSKASSELGVVDARIKPFRLNLVEAKALPIAHDAVEIPQSYWQINFINALTLCDQAGGNAFRSTHPAGYKVNATLAKEDGNILAWYVTYTDTQTSQTESYVVNASEGTVEQVR